MAGRTTPVVCPAWGEASTLWSVWGRTHHAVPAIGVAPKGLTEVEHWLRSIVGLAPHTLTLPRAPQLGAHVNIRDMMGCTALHWAASSGHLKKSDQQQAVLIAELLLRDGVDVTFEDFNGKTAIELTSKPNPTVCDLLGMAGCLRLCR